MKTSTLGDLLTIQLCTPSVRDYNPDAAIETWMRAVNTPRRPTFKDGMTPRSGSLEEVPNQGGTADMEVEDEQEQDVFFNEEDEPEVGNTETDTEIEDNQMTAYALYRKLSEFST